MSYNENHIIYAEFWMARRILFFAGLDKMINTIKMEFMKSVLFIASIDSDRTERWFRGAPAHSKRCS